MADLSIIGSNNILYHHIDFLLENSRASFYLKNHDGAYLNVNGIFESYTGLKSNDILGKNDFDFWKNDEASYMRENDIVILSTEKSKTFFEYTTVAGLGAKLFLSIKSPLKNKMGKSIGILGLSYMCEENEDLPERYEKLGYLLGSSDTELINEKKSNDSIYNGLTLRQCDCLYYLILGKSAKQIARILEISARTVEDHFNKLKIKLNCATRSDLFSKALKIPYVRNRLFLHSLKDDQS